MWTLVFEVLNKAIDLVGNIWRRKTETQDDESAKVSGSELRELGRASGKAAYEASKLAGPPQAGWYYIQGVRYCSVCRTRRCKRQEFGNIPCIPVALQGKARSEDPPR